MELFGLPYLIAIPSEVSDANREICDKINPDFNGIVDKALKADGRKKAKIAQKKLDNVKRN